MINGAAIRKGLQSAYGSSASLVHIHRHAGRGTPRFSKTDLVSAHEFVPSFFNAVPHMPHGIVVLSDDSHTGSCGLVHTSRPYR